ncbi:MAG: thiamine diphosphokinase [Peptococcaceae bacterium]|nr:thiamine diphosphokinase [Peptococcaceae bacterium]
MKVVVIANGEWDAHWGQMKLEQEKIDCLICADGGGNLAISSGKVPDILVGDLDSITPENLKICRENNTQIEEYPRKKNETDLELALKYAETVLQSHGKQEDEIHLYAGGGKRLDHLLGNIALLLHAAENNRRVKMIDQTFSAWVILPGKETICGIPGQELSLIPLSESAEVTSRGLYYELNRLCLRQDTARGISNVFRDNGAEIEVHHGKVFLVLLEKKS